jgi:hypothetical protein
MKIVIYDYYNYEILIYRFKTQYLFWGRFGKGPKRLRPKRLE